MIIRNVIRESRCEGIFIIESGFAWIVRNEIIDNADGIVTYDATPFISGNSIQHNQRSGLTCCGCSFPKIEKNQIYGNAQSGINFRDQSKALAEGNHIYSNFYQFSARSFTRNDVKNMKSLNKIEGDVEVCNNCSIF